jgi:YegS/Rv2252/BmrU family lipid kinase
MKQHIRFIINPISGVGKRNILPKLISRYIDQSVFEYDFVYTEYRGHATELAKNAVSEKIDIVCAVGGDGSVNEVGIALIDTNTSLAILPTGSGNGLARHLKLSLRLKKSIRNLNNASKSIIDTVKIDDRHFIGVAGFGFDALVAEKFDKYHTRGFLSYAKLVIKEFRNFKGISIRVNNEEYVENLLFCTFANASQFGNGFIISPKSNMKDGVFEIVCIKNPSFLGFILLLIRSYLGRIDKSMYFSSIKVNQATIETSETNAHIDGEPVKFNSNSLTLNCQSSSLSVLINN